MPYLAFLVLYTRRGPTRAVFELAESMKKAIESKALERNGGQPLEQSVPGEFTGGLLSYNVFVVVGQFSMVYSHVICWLND